MASDNPPSRWLVADFSFFLSFAGPPKQARNDYSRLPWVPEIAKMEKNDVGSNKGLPKCQICTMYHNSDLKRAIFAQCLT